MRRERERERERERQEEEKASCCCWSKDRYTLLEGESFKTKKNHFEIPGTFPDGG